MQGIQSFNDRLKKTIKFMGLALEGHYEWDWYYYFLNQSNHISNNIPIDYISFHFYAHSNNRTNPETYQTFFEQVFVFLSHTHTHTPNYTNLVFFFFFATEF